MSDSANFTNFDPLADVKNQFQEVSAQVESSLNAPVAPVESAPLPAPEITSIPDPDPLTQVAAPEAAKRDDAVALDLMPKDRAVEVLFQAAAEDSSLRLLPWIEREFTLRAMQKTGDNQVRAAKMLGITRATLRKRLDRNASNALDEEEE